MRLRSVPDPVAPGQRLRRNPFLDPVPGVLAGCLAETAPPGTFPGRHDPRLGRNPVPDIGAARATRPPARTVRWPRPGADRQRRHGGIPRPFPIAHRARDPTAGHRPVIVGPARKPAPEAMAAAAGKVE